MVLWYSSGNTWGTFIGFPQGYHDAQLPVGVSRFWSPTFLWFYVWFLVSTALFVTFFSAIVIKFKCYAHRFEQLTQIYRLQN